MVIEYNACITELKKQTFSPMFNKPKGMFRSLTFRQGIFLDHLALVTTNTVFIDYGYEHPKEHYPDLYFLGQGPEVTLCGHVTS